MTIADEIAFEEAVHRLVTDGADLPTANVMGSLLMGALCSGEADLLAKRGRRMSEDEWIRFCRGVFRGPWRDLVNAVWSGKGGASS